MAHNFKLGQTLADRVSGFKGIADVRTDFLNGNVQFSLKGQVHGKDQKAPHQAFDAFQLELVSEGGVEAIPAPADTGIALGEKVKDIVTGMSGIAISKSTFLNGCVYYTVAADSKQDPKDLNEFFFDYCRLKRVSSGVVGAIKTRLAGQPPTGGPAYRVPARG